MPDDILDAPQILTDSEIGAKNAELETPPTDTVTPDTPDGTEPIVDPAEGDAPEGDEAEEEEEAIPGETPEQKAAREAEEALLTPEQKAQRKLENALDAPIPQDLSKRTSERIQTLISATREATEARDAVQKDLSSITGALINSGTTPEQFREFVEFRAGLSSGDPAKQEAAFRSLVEMVSTLSDVLGLPISIKNPVERHADLVAKVQQGKLTLQDAEEIARARNRAASAQLPSRPQGQQQPQQGTPEQETAARTALNRFEERMQRNDPQYQAKKDLILPLLKPIFAQLPFSQWEKAFKDAYMGVKVPAVAKTQAQRQNPSGNQPMRHGKRPAGGTAKSPGSLMDAVVAGIAQANG